MDNDDEFDQLLQQSENTDFHSQLEFIGSNEDLPTHESEDESMLDYAPVEEGEFEYEIEDTMSETSLPPTWPTYLSHAEHQVQSEQVPQVDHDLAATSTQQPEPTVGLPTATVSNRPSVDTSPGESVINKIEAVFEQMVDDMLNERGELSILLKTRVSKDTPSPSQMSSSRDRKTSFPGKNAEEAWRFTVVARLLEMMHEALLGGKVITKRDMYYRDPKLFNNQSTVDRYVDDIALTFNVPRSLLNVTAAAKGLIAGAATFCRNDGSTLSVAADRDGTLVPSLRDILSVNMQATKWVLVVEKEATFRSIAASAFSPALSQHGVMITGKGYPDIATRALLHFMTTPSSRNGYASPRVLGLVDFDPDGLAILNTYKFGSARLAHEGPKLCVPRIEWLGLRSEHVVFGGEDLHATQGLLPLSKRDRRKAAKMLEQYVEGVDEGERDVRRELQRMLVLGVKAELQLLCAVPNGMENLLRSALGGEDMM